MRNLLFALGGLALLEKSEAVLPAHLVGMVLAPFYGNLMRNPGTYLHGAEMYAPPREPI